MFLQGEQVFFHRVVDAEINHLKTGALHHHAHQILANIVDVALDRSDYHFSNRLYPSFCEQRPQDFHAALHGIGSQQDLWNKQNSVTKINPNNAHALDQSVIQHPVCRPAATKKNMGGLNHLVAQAVVEIIMNLLGQLFVVERAEV